MFLAPWHHKGWNLRKISYIIVSTWTPSGTGLVMEVLWNDNMTPFSSDKIQAKSARILSAAITRTTLLSAGVRIGPLAGARIGPPAGVRTIRDDFHWQVG